MRIALSKEQYWTLVLSAGQAVQLDL